MTPQQIYMRALDRLRARIAAMERNLNGASLAVHEEFEELCLIVSLLDQVVRGQEHAPRVLQLAGERAAALGGESHTRRNGQPPPLTLLPQTPESPVSATAPAYAILDIVVRNPEAFALYLANHQATVEQHGGRVLVARTSCEVVAGDWHPKGVVMHHWPSAEAFHRWYDLELALAWKHASVATVTNVVLVEGSGG